MYFGRYPLLHHWSCRSNRGMPMAMVKGKNEEGDMVDSVCKDGWMHGHVDAWMRGWSIRKEKAFIPGWKVFSLYFSWALIQKYLMCTKKYLPKTVFIMCTQSIFAIALDWIWASVSSRFILCKFAASSFDILPFPCLSSCVSLWVNGCRVHFRT